MSKQRSTSLDISEPLGSNDPKGNIENSEKMLVAGNKKKRLESQSTENSFHKYREIKESGHSPKEYAKFRADTANLTLKQQFGWSFLVLTTVFTAASYVIVICDGVYKLGISPTAITALVIETPLQFIGLLFVIARNLFPQHSGHP